MIMYETTVDQKLKRRMLKRVAHIIPIKEIDQTFYDCLRVDALSFMAKEPIPDIPFTNFLLSQADEEYDSAVGAYRGERGVSMEMYVYRKFGPKYVELIRALLER